MKRSIQFFETARGGTKLCQEAATHSWLEAAMHDDELILQLLRRPLSLGGIYSEGVRVRKYGQNFAINFDI